MRCTFRSLCTFALGMAAGLALSPFTRGRPPASRIVERAAGFAGAVVSVSPDAGPAVAERLAALLPPVRYDGVPLDGVIENLRDTSGADIFVNWRALQLSGLRRDLPVTLALPSQSLRDRLEQVLRTVGGNRVALGATVDDGVVSVSTGEDLSKNVVTRVYDVRHLVRPGRRADDVAAAICLLQGIDPWSWQAFGGSAGAFRELSGQLIVTQMPEAHARIAAVLAETPALGPVSPGPSLTPRPRATAGRALPSRRLNAAGYSAPTTRPAPGEPTHNAPQF